MDVRPIRRLLVANRGEIARRVFRTARRLGIETIAIYSDADRHSPHTKEADLAVPLGGERSDESYLDIAKVLDAARRSGADAIHPGYGFLSENVEFSRACDKAGIVLVGPGPDAIAAMALKIESKDLAVAHDVPVLPSRTLADSNEHSWHQAGMALGMPVLVKASAGGGGRGMRIVHKPDDLVEAIHGARREALAAFSDGTVFLERYLPAPRHIEVQVLGDRHGTLLHLGERECSIQRRHQKVVEEAPSPTLGPEMRARMTTAAVRLAKAINYVGVGTVEFLVQDDEFYFLEMNTRLQVEHPVTEAVTGLDLVEMQILVAEGRPLPLAQEDVVTQGAAVEVRLYAEDPTSDYLPSPGTLELWHEPDSPGLRIDSAVYSGTEVSQHYDPMLAKVIGFGPDRRSAIDVLRHGMAQLRANGVTTNRELLMAILDEPDFLAGRTPTSYLSDHQDLLTCGPPADVVRALAVATALVAAQHDREAVPLPNDLEWGWRNIGRATYGYSLSCREHDFQILPRADGPTGERMVVLDGKEETVDVIGINGGMVDLVVEGLRRRCQVGAARPGTSGERRWWASSGSASLLFSEVDRLHVGAVEDASSAPVSPMPGTVVAVHVAAGDSVAAGDTLVVIEAMKMEHRIRAERDATVVEVRVQPGQQVEAHAVLLELE